MTSLEIFKNNQLGRPTSKLGFTLIELLIVIAITLILGVSAVPIYGNLQVSAQLNSTGDQLVQTLRTAKERSTARVNNSSHGVYFEINSGSEDRIIFYQGSSYAGRDSDYDRVTKLDDAITLSTTLAESEVSFSKGVGTPNTTGTVTLTHSVDGERVVTINNIGTVEEE